MVSYWDGMLGGLFFVFGLGHLLLDVTGERVMNEKERKEFL